MEPKWNLECCDYFAIDPKASPLEFYKLHLQGIRQNSLQMDSANRVAMMQDAAFEYLYLAWGRRRWFVSRDMFEAINSLKIEDEHLKFNEFQIPYDSMGFVFEKGTELAGIPFRFMMFSYPRSEVSTRILAEIKAIPDPETISIQIDCGQSGKIDAAGNCIPDYDHERPISDTILCPCMQSAQKPFAPVIDLSHGTNAFTQYAEAIRFAAKAYLYYSWRPEFVVPYELSRAQRYNFGSAESRKNISRIMFPDKIIRHPKSGEVHSTGKTQPYHIRGWSIRTLRHEKFSRNSDGSLKIILVPPYEVHAELKEENQK